MHAIRRSITVNSNHHQLRTTGFTTELASYLFIKLKEARSSITMADQAQLAGLLAESDPISNLNTQLPVASPVSMEDFVEQCSGLIDGFDPGSHTDPRKRSISLPKSRLAVTPFQLWEAWKMLNQRERTGGLRGGLQASAAGCGKSFIVITAALLRARCFESERLVKAFWSNPKKGSKRGPTAASHLPASASGDGLKCPSQKESDLLCYCVPTSKARSFVDSGAPRGISLIQSPLPVVDQWLSIFENAVLDTSAYNLIIAHSDVPARLKRDLGRVTKSLSQPAGRGQLEAPETYIFLSAHGNKKMLDIFTDEFAPSIGIMFSDESHVAMRLESRSMAIAEAQSKVGEGLDLWLVSATPVRLLEDFELPISLISNSSDLSRAAAVADIIAARTTARTSDQNMATFQARWRRVFDDNLVLRNTVTSQFCEKSITDLQIVSPKRVFLTTPQHHFNNVQAVAHQAREVIRTRARTAAENNETFRPEYASGLDARLHFVSHFPGAANLIQQGRLDIDEESVRQSIDAMKEPNKLKVEKIPRFQQHLEEIVAGSPKLDFIVAEFRRMGSDPDQRAAGSVVQTGLHREDRGIKKMVIVTPTLGTAVFLYLFLLKRMPTMVPVLWHTRSRPEHREAAMNSFASLTARKNAKHSYILITPFFAGGTGLNLQSANYQILTSPLSTRDAETQCFARTNRTGQRLALHHTVLITQDNPADQINMVNFAGRSIRNDPFEMSRRLVLFEPDGSKVVSRLEDWGYEAHNLVVEEDKYQYLIKETYPIIDESEFHGIHVTVPSNGREVIDELIYFDAATIAGDTMAVSEAWNERGDTRPKHEKLPLRDILVSLWVHRLNRPLRDLRNVIYYVVVQEDLRDQHRRFIYRLLGEDLTNELVVHKNSESSQEAEAFNFLRDNTPFCIGAQKMLEENPDYSGIQIQSFEFLPPEAEKGPNNPDPWFHFRINMG